MTFLTPIWLLVLVPIVALVITYLLMQRRRQRYAVRFATLPMLDRVVPRRPRWRRHLPAALLLLALTIIGVGAGRPELDLRVPYERATVIVAIDSSGSMQSDDVSPTRIDAAKAAAARFVESMPDGFNVGAVQFAGSAAVVAPATTDHAEVAERIRDLRLAGGGTAIGEAVYASIDEVARIAASGDGSTSGRSVGGDVDAGRRPIPTRLVLLSDGDNTSGRSPSAAAQAAVDAGMPVSTIAYGTPNGTIINYDGTQQAVPVNETALRQLASATEGQFYRATSDQQLNRVYDDIGSSIGYRTQATEITPFLLSLGLLITLIGAALSLRWFSRLI